MIRERLRLTPDERVDGALAFADFVIDTQRANRRSRSAA
jgi:hypothetical protein